MRRKISYILLALIIAYSSLIGCIFAVGYYYEATVVAEEREEQHEDKINKLAKNRGAHRDYVKELNGELDKEKSNSDIIDAIMDYYEHNDYSPLFEKSDPYTIDWFVPGYDNVDEIFLNGSHIIYSINNVHTYNIQSDKLFVAKDSLLNKFCTIINGETFSGCE